MSKELNKSILDTLEEIGKHLTETKGIPKDFQQLWDVLDSTPAPDDMYYQRRHKYIHRFKGKIMSIKPA